MEIFQLLGQQSYKGLVLKFCPKMSDTSLCEKIWISGSTGSGIPFKILDRCEVNLSQFTYWHINAEAEVNGRAIEKAF